MWAHLTLNGAAARLAGACAPCRAAAKPGKAPAITAANVPPIVTAPAAANAITFAGTTLVIPD